MSARINNSSVVFLGDSLTEGFDLERYFPTANVVNRGLSGDTTYQVRYRMDEIVIANPAKLFLMIGINDLFQGETGRTFRNKIDIANSG